MTKHHNLGGSDTFIIRRESDDCFHKMEKPKVGSSSKYKIVGIINEIEFSNLLTSIRKPKIVEVEIFDRKRTPSKDV